MSDEPSKVKEEAGEISTEAEGSSGNQQPILGKYVYFVFFWKQPKQCSFILKLFSPSAACLTTSLDQSKKFRYQAGRRCERSRPSKENSNRRGWLLARGNGPNLRDDGRVGEGGETDIRLAHLLRGLPGCEELRGSAPCQCP